MTARVERLAGGKFVVRAPLRDWHVAGRFLHFHGGDGNEVDLACPNAREGDRTAAYVNGQVEAKAILAKARAEQMETDHV